MRVWSRAARTIAPSTRMVVCPRSPLWRDSSVGLSSSDDMAGLETQSSAEITNADLADATSMPPAGVSCGRGSRLGRGIQAGPFSSAEHTGAGRVPNYLPGDVHGSPASTLL